MFVTINAGGLNVPVKVIKIFRQNSKPVYCLHDTSKTQKKLKVKGWGKYTRGIIIVRQNRLFGRRDSHFLIIKLCSLRRCNSCSFILYT